jgi:hypothetical protein
MRRSKTRKQEKKRKTLLCKQINKLKRDKRKADKLALGFKSEE